jgi:hypothetical protein
MVAVRAVPHWKLFCFGGKTGDLSFELGAPVGTFNNDVMVLETGSTTPDQWVKPSTVGALPTARADSPLAYDPATSQLVLFGGWSSRWLGDLWICRVRSRRQTRLWSRQTYIYILHGRCLGCCWNALCKPVPLTPVLHI